MTKSLRIALLGSGNMGQEVEQLALQKGHVVQLIIDRPEQWQTLGDQLKSCDVAIEFTTPETAPQNMMQCFAQGVPIVCGTTGWYDQLPDITKACEEQQGTLFYSPNFSIGVNIFFLINSFLAKIMSGQAGYHVSMTEIHHTRKKDAPSGTALKLAHDIIENHQGITGWTNKSDTDQPGMLPVEAIRQGDVTGTHEVRYTSDVDSIEIKHVANNRRGFSEGAILAAEWVLGRKGIYTMKHILNH